jgi:parvulin-like peptidyl-prolyl isomerase
MSQQEADFTTSQSSTPASERPGAESAAKATRSRKSARTSQSWRRSVPVILGALAVVAACVAIKWIGGRSEADAQSAPRDRVAGKTVTPRPAATPANAARTADASMSVVAIVNREEISREELARECLTVYGKEVLQSVVNKQLILGYCQRMGIAITEKDVQDEIDRMARKFALTTDQYLAMLKQERGIRPEQYASDIVWPMLALRRLAQDQITPTAAELKQAFESQYGEAIKVRIIVLDDEESARRVQAQAAKNPDDFGALAKNHSKDPSASMNGLIQPIRRGNGHSEIENAAFTLADGQVSRVIPITLGAGREQGAVTQYVILKRESLLPAMKVNPKLAEERLRESIVEGKLRTAAAEVFQKLQSEAVVVNVMNDPAKSAQMPGVAATINGRKITLRELAEECLSRHGVEVLDGTISRHLLAQELKRRNLTVTERDEYDEIARAALSMGYKTANGQPDVQKWLTAVKEEQGLSLDVYKRDSVWPSVALKKLAGEVQISKEDLQKGYEANYGPRVRCRAIVVANQRRAQEIWEQARTNPTAEYFGQLAEEHSIEPSSKALQGKVPPIQRHGGQPNLEKEAFSLKPGELSSIVQVVDKFVILFCEGYTEPIQVSFDEVKQEIANDIREKKQRISMAEVFNKLRDSAQIDNFLAGTTQSAAKQASHTSPVPSGRPPVSRTAAQRLPGSRN